MIHAREDYNRIQDPENKIGIDEPVFLLRAKDVIAPSIVEKWGLALLEAGGSEEMATMALDHADRMRRWQVENGSKIPNL